MEPLIPGLVVLAILWLALKEGGAVLGMNFSGARLGRGFLRLAWLCVKIPFVLAIAFVTGCGAFLGDRSTSIVCTNGCGREVPLEAVVTCRSCGYRSQRNGFAPCPNCGAALLHVRCPFCAMSIPRPASWTQTQPTRRYL